MKPSHVLTRADGQVKPLARGIAKILGSQQPAGPAGPAPPGQNAGKATPPAQAARGVLDEQPTRPSALSPSLVADPSRLARRQSLAGDLDTVLLKALVKRPEQRDTTRRRAGGLPPRPPGG